MDLIWMRPARQPVGPNEIEDLSSPARRVLEALENRFLPRNRGFGSTYQPRPLADHGPPIPCFSISSNSRAVLRPHETRTHDRFSQMSKNAVCGREPDVVRPGNLDRSPDQPTTSKGMFPCSSLDTFHHLSQRQAPSRQNQDVGIFMPRLCLAPDSEGQDNLDELDNLIELEGAKSDYSDFLSLSNFTSHHPHSESQDALEELNNLIELADNKTTSTDFHPLAIYHPPAGSVRSSPISFFECDGANERAYCHQEDGECPEPKLDRKGKAKQPNGDREDCSCSMRDETQIIDEPLNDNNPKLSLGHHELSIEDELSLYDSMGSNTTLSPEKRCSPISVGNHHEKSLLVSGKCFHVANTTPKFSQNKELDTNFAHKNSTNLFGSSSARLLHPVVNPAKPEHGLQVSEKMISESSFDYSFDSDRVLSFSSDEQNAELGMPQNVFKNQVAQKCTPIKLSQTKKRKKFLGTPFKRALSSSCISGKEFREGNKIQNVEEYFLNEEASSLPVKESSLKEKAPSLPGTESALQEKESSLQEKAPSLPEKESSLPVKESSLQENCRAGNSSKLFSDRRFPKAESSYVGNIQNQSVTPRLLQTSVLDVRTPIDPPSTSLYPIFQPNCSMKHKGDNNDKTTTGPFKKKIKFAVPYKKKEGDTALSTQKEIQELSAVLSRKSKPKQTLQQLSENLAADVSKRIASTPPQETSMTVQYRGGFCQMNRPKTCETYYPESVLLRIVWSSDVQYISIPLQKHSWSSAFVETLFSNQSRKICFEAQEIIQLLIDKFSIDASKVSSQWLILDPLIGCWLLNPDDPPHSFKEVLNVLNLDEDGTGMEILLNKLSKCAEVLYDNLTKTGLWKVFLHIEMRITPMLACMELHGIHIDEKKFQEMAALLKFHLEKAQKLAHEAAGRKFQLNSPQQLGNVLYDHLKLDVKHQISVVDTKKKHNKSTSESTLIKFKDFHPLPGAVLEFRRLHKLKSTYVDAILDNASNNCIYTTWDQISAATGRITSSDPNLQTIPKQPLMPDLPDLVLRSAFVAREGYSFLGADFLHIELRVFAHLSNDSALIKALRETSDVFKVLSKQWLQIADINNVSEEDRDKTKRIVYALMYGAGPSNLVEFLHIDLNEAKKIVKKFSATFPKVQGFRKKVIDECRKKGYLTTETGRRRLFPNINSNNFQLRTHSERQAVNFLIQGTAADLCKCAMVNTQCQLTAKSTHKSVNAARLLLQIHDELLWEIPDADLMIAADIVQEAMEGATAVFQSLSSFSVPFPVMVKVGKTWGGMTMVKNTSLGTASQKP